jgi:hypothetical protein
MTKIPAEIFTLITATCMTSIPVRRVIRGEWQFMTLPLLLASLPALPAGAGAAPRVIEKQLSLAGSGSTLVRGTIAPGTEDSWNFRVGRGKEARVRIFAGAKQVVCDLTTVAA